MRISLTTIDGYFTNSHYGDFRFFFSFLFPQIDCLTEANHELTKKLEFASGKIEAVIFLAFLDYQLHSKTLCFIGAV